MWISAAFSAVHLLALGVGLGSVYARGRALERSDVPAVLRADAWWGVAALLWLGSGLMRAFGGLEKGTAYYLASHAFQVKMGLFVLVVALEAWPMITFIRWRTGRTPDLTKMAALARINRIELVLVLLIPFVAAAMARGM